MTSSNPNIDLRILHIEDDDADAFLMQRCLHKGSNHHKLNFSRVDNLKDALALIDTMRFDIVLLDLNLGPVCGLDCLGAIRSVLPETPVVVLSGMESDITEQNAYQLGANGYLVKGRQDGAQMCDVIIASLNISDLDDGSKRI